MKRRKLGLWGKSFSLGRIVVVSASLKSRPPSEITDALVRHNLGDWGDVTERRRQVNDKSVWKKRSLRSIYSSKNGIRFHIVTNADRSLTKVQAF